MADSGRRNMRSKVGMIKHLFLSIILSVAAVGSVRGSSEVTETSSPYSCCEPAIQFDLRCEITCSINNKPIAFAKGLHKECINPCKKIEGGLMTLDECVHVNATMVCTDVINVPAEKRIYYYAQPCSGSPTAPGNQGSVGLLLALVIGGLIVKHLIC